MDIHFIQVRTDGARKAKWKNLYKVMLSPSLPVLFKRVVKFVILSLLFVHKSN